MSTCQSASLRNSENSSGHEYSADATPKCRPHSNQRLQEYLPADPVDRLEHPPGRTAQCDLWFPLAKIPVGFGQEAMVAGAGDGGGVLPVLSPR
ncbi:MAG: hypothetical protein QOJ61_1128 [Mycobacterium sp.]|jgi:hypothetical protein|nr:hypothetical protein [Mycobacterium sp.]